jgi:hypothetical protein
VPVKPCGHSLGGIGLQLGGVPVKPNSHRQFGYL